MTIRAVVVGLLLSFVVGAAGPYCTLYLQGSNAGDVFFTNPAAHFLFFLLIGVVNVALGLLHRPWALRSSELATIYIMMIVANGTHTLVNYLVAMVSGPFYYANDVNDWVDRLHPYIPDWIAPRDLAGIQTFFEGGAGGLGPILRTWAVPLISWAPLLLALHLAMITLMVIFRRQWMEQERIVYPLIQVPLAMIGPDEDPSPIRPFFRSKIMWSGFAVSFIVGLAQAVHRYLPYVPTIQLQTTIELVNNSVVVPVSFSFASIGLFFLLNREVALGLWVFSLLNIVQRALSSRLGVGWTTEPALSVWSYNDPSLVHQSMGAMIVLVLGGMWVGRGHLINVALKSIGRARDVDDSDEIISYRAAVFTLLGSVAVIALWLRMSGIPWLGVAVFLFFAFVVYMAITRVVVEGGVAMLFPPMVAPDAAVSAVGTSFFGPTGMVGLMFTRVWANDILNFAMPHCANGLKMGQQIQGRRRWLFWAMFLAIVVGICGGIAALLKLGAAYGAINLRPQHFIWLPEYIGNYAAERIADPTHPSWAGWVHTVLGGVVMALLMLARRHVYWWPVHPLGYPISSVFTWMMTSAFLAWLLKGTLLRYGGLSAYRLVRPFFLGLIVGQFAIFGTFWLVDSWTGMVGNELVW
jgi:hypothetical protein